MIINVRRDKNVPENDGKVEKKSEIPGAVGKVPS